MAPLGAHRARPPRPRPPAAHLGAAGDALWLPNTERPEWLDGSLPGDRGFDPLGLSKPVEYLQVDVSLISGGGWRSGGRRRGGRRRRVGPGRAARSRVGWRAARHPACAAGAVWRGHVLGACTLRQHIGRLACLPAEASCGARSARAASASSPPCAHSLPRSIHPSFPQNCSHCFALPQLDSLDQNLAVNKPGNTIGKFAPVTDVVSEDRLQPYSEVFGLQRFRECELIHGRWVS